MLLTNIAILATVACFAIYQDIFVCEVWEECNHGIITLCPIKKKIKPPCNRSYCVERFTDHNRFLHLVTHLADLKNLGKEQVKNELVSQLKLNFNNDQKKR